MTTVNKYFEQVLLRIENMVSEHKLTEVAYKTWIQRLEPVGLEDNVFTVRVRDDETGFTKSIIMERYIEFIDEAFRDVMGDGIKLNITSAYDELPEEKRPKPHPGMYEYTFDNFIVGKSNEFAHAASLAVANKPGGAYNPLFIHGSSGLGKTHLMHAIANRILENQPKTNIIYVTGEIFTNELIEAIQRQDTASFRDKYRNTDVLLVDDIQFISGKESTQEEFFHTFNELHTHGKQIVLTSDRPPKNIKTLEDRIRTRFEWGLIADVGEPELETRIAIIKRKADTLQLNLTDDVVMCLANRLKTNVRQLEGCVKKLAAYQELMNAPPTIIQAQNVIREILSDEESTGALTPDIIIKHVAGVYGVREDEIRSKSRSKNISTARKVCAYVLKETKAGSLQNIGAELGGKDHATVSFYISDISKQMQSDPFLKETVDDILRNLTRGRSE